MKSFPPTLTLSIVSHGQSNLVGSLLKDLAKLTDKNFEILITVNLPENESSYINDSLSIKIIRNDKPKGFGENHNVAFSKSSGDFFAAVNPDIRIQSLNIEDLIAPFGDDKIAALAPIVLSKSGEIEDNARRFPTFFQLIKRVIFRKRISDYEPQTFPYEVDWVAGMFVVFRPDAYRQISGFDSRRFFMYMEDADICRRLHKNGWGVLVNPSVKVIHMAQRASRRNLKHMRWHAISAVRYLTGL